MKILVIGGTGFIGPDIVRYLSEKGHEVTVFHRGHTKADLPSGVNRILGDRQELGDRQSEFQQLAPQVVLDLIPATEQDAQMLMSTFKGISQRVVAISSGDVYRAYGVLLRTESGPVEPVPLTEDSPLRQQLYPMRDMPQRPYNFPADYEKIVVERVVMGDPDLPGTVLRLPMIYGSRDPLHRLFGYLQRMNDQRPAIVLEEGVAKWRSPRGYVENVAAAIALAVTDDRATGRIYNVSEAEAFSEAEWVRQIGQVVGWKGEVVTVPSDRLPPHLREQGNTDQHWVFDTSRIRTELGYDEPVPRLEALQRTIDWERSHPPNEILQGAAPEMIDYATEDAVLAELGW